MTELSRKHFFRDDNDNRTVVITELRANGQFKAYVLKGNNDDIIAFGFGHTRLAAIANLNDNIALERS